jgi:hypothetical protein
MLYRLFSGLSRTARTERRHRQAPTCRLAVEQLEDRLVPSSVPAALATQTQAIVNPANLGSGPQYQQIQAGTYQTIASQTVTVNASQTGLFTLTFQAQAFDSINNRAGVRYLIDGQTDPNDAVFIKGGTAADVSESIAVGAWQTLFLTRQLTLSAGTHVVSIQVTCTAESAVPSDNLAVYTPVLSVVGYGLIDGKNTADGVQSQTLANPATPQGGQQNIVAGTYQTVAGQTLTVGANKTGLYDLSFQAQAYSSMPNLVHVRYLIDGHPDATDLATRATPSGSDTTETFNEGIGSGGWHTLLLTHQLVLAAGTHTISVQVECTSTGVLSPDLIVYTPSLSLIGYNKVDGLRAADGAQAQALTRPASSTLPGQQFITAGSFQTVASIAISVGPNKTGLYALDFQAQAFATSTNRVLVRYLIDGRPDANDAAITESLNSADTSVEFLNRVGNPTWHTLALQHLLTLSAGNHTISVQVECSNSGSTPGQDLVVCTPDLALTGFNNIVTTSGSSLFSYNPANQVVTVNGTSGTDLFQFNEASVRNTTGVLVTTYYLTMDGQTQTFMSSQVTRVVVNSKGGNDTAILVTSDTYIGADGKIKETREQVVLSPSGGVLQKFNGSAAYTFMQLNKFNTIYAYMGHADSSTLTDSAGADTFVSAGSYSYMFGQGYFNLVSGAQSVTAMSNSGGHDQAYQYDGSGPSIFTITGSVSSTMSGTDNGQSFLNRAVGFAFTYAIASHGNDTAVINAGAGPEVFVGDTSESYLYAATDGNLSMFDAAYGFTKVYANGANGGRDVAYVHDAKVNIVTGFHPM